MLWAGRGSGARRFQGQGHDTQVLASCSSRVDPAATPTPPHSLPPPPPPHSHDAGEESEREEKEKTKVEEGEEKKRTEGARE